MILIYKLVGEFNDDNGDVSDSECYSDNEINL